MRRATIVFSEKSFLFEMQTFYNEAFLLFNNMDFFGQTEQYRAIKKHLDSISNTYIDGTHATCEEIAFYGRFDFKSNNNVENINRMKNRLARKAAQNGRKTRNNLFFTYF